MYFLILETSSEKSLFAIAKENKIIYKKDLVLGVRESTELVPAIEMGLNECHLKVEQISTIILGHGPGSFTGLRMGASIAKAFSYAHSIPIIPISSLKTSAPTTEGPFAILLDAKAKGIYIQKGLLENGEVYFDDEIHLSSAEDLNKYLNPSLTLMSAQKKSLATKISQELQDRLIEVSPDPEIMLKMALKRPKAALVQASDELELEYFNTP